MGPRQHRRPRLSHFRTADDDYVMDGALTFAGKWSSRLEDRFESQYARPDPLVSERSSVTTEELRASGFEVPLVLRGKPEGLDVPDECTVADVCRGVGKNAEVSVLDVADQEVVGTWTLEEWVQYWGSSRSRTLNVITLEVSHSNLGRRISAPSVVRDVDWTTTVGPVKGPWTTVATAEVSNNKAKKRKIRDESLRRQRPTVQKYCLMSPAGCFTDFHVDFAGSSVWYHVSRGRKVFYVAAPTPANLADFESWSRSPAQGSSLLADVFAPRRELERIELDPGDTLLLPSGWIHAVATPVDSVVFGGNFVHSLSVRLQFEVAALEDRLGVSVAARMPYFEMTAWYVAIRMAHKLWRVHRLLQVVDDLLEDYSHPEVEVRRRVLGGPRGLEAARLLALDLRDRLETQRLISGQHLPLSIKSPGCFLDGFDALLDGRAGTVIEPPIWWHRLKDEDAASWTFVPGEDAPVQNIYWGNHDVRCLKCGLAGELLCCDFCSNTEHAACASILADNGEGLWACTECQPKLDYQMKLYVAEPQAAPGSLNEHNDVQATAQRDDDQSASKPSEDGTQQEKQPRRSPYPWWLPRDPDREAWFNETTAARHPGITLDRLRAWSDLELRAHPYPVKTKDQVGSPTPRKPSGAKKSPSSGKRRNRCGECGPCTRPNCGQCRACRNMPRFGGPGTLKIPCLLRKCVFRDIAPTTATDVAQASPTKAPSIRTPPRSPPPAGASPSSVTPSSSPPVMQPQVNQSPLLSTPTAKRLPPVDSPQQQPVPLSPQQPRENPPPAVSLAESAPSLIKVLPSPTLQEASEEKVASTKPLSAECVEAKPPSSTPNKTLPHSVAESPIGNMLVSSPQLPERTPQPPVQVEKAPLHPEAARVVEEKSPSSSTPLQRSPTLKRSPKTGLRPTY